VLAIVESMKMEHEVRADSDGEIAPCAGPRGDVVVEGEVLLSLQQATRGQGGRGGRRVRPAPPRPHPPPPSPPVITPIEPSPPPGPARRPARAAPPRGAHRATTPAGGRREAPRAGLRTARENLADLCDPDSFVEYGALAFAAQQRARRSTT
jgi:pyruvate/2-oxoglutarate dehydrogenase complex dihydrolipoamide acyltransferase (E2) component